MIIHNQALEWLMELQRVNNLSYEFAASVPGLKDVDVVHLKNKLDSINYLINLVQQNAWHDAESEPPKRFVSVLVYIPGEAPCPTVREGYLGVDHWVAGGFHRHPGEVLLWKPMPDEPSKEG